MEAGVLSHKPAHSVAQQNRRIAIFYKLSKNKSSHFAGRLSLLSCIVLAMLFMNSCSSLPNSTSDTLEKQIELQQIQHELASEPVAAEQKTAAELEQLGDRYLHKNDITRAYLYYTKGLGIEPNNISLLHKQAAILVKNNKFTVADQIYEKLLTLDGNDSQALAGRSKALFGQGRFGEAEQGFLAALKIKSDNWLAYEYLGLIYSQKQEYEKAISLYKTALSYKPKNVSVTNNLAVTYYLIGDFKEAVRLFREVAATINDRKIYNNLALAYFQLGQYENALDSFKRGSGNEAAAYNNMGREYLFVRKYNEAIGSFEKAIALHPKHYLSAQKNLEQAKRGLSNVIAEKAN